MIAKLLYGSGLRLIGCLPLRVKACPERSRRDVDFAQRQIIVREGKGEKDRVAMLLDSLIESLQKHLRRVEMLHQKDLDDGYGAVYLPDALEQKYPNANCEWIWQYVFPSKSPSKDPRSGVARRHHLHESAVQRAVREAAKLANINKHITPLCLPPLLRCPPAPRWLRHAYCPRAAGAQGLS